MKMFQSAFLCAALSFTLFSCSEKSTSENAKARLQVKMIDAPANFEAVYVDVLDVQCVYSADSTAEWQSLPNVSRANVNLLDLVNGNSLLLADAEIPTGMIYGMRLVLGNNNYIVVDGVNVPLETPSAQQSGLKLKMEQQVQEGVVYKMILDFDAAKSIVKTGNKKYNLKPVIRMMMEADGGSIAGAVSPDGFQTAVYAVNGTDTISTTYSAYDGKYSIRGLEPGSYELHFFPADAAYQKASKSNVIVTYGSVTTVEPVTLVR